MKAYLSKIGWIGLSVILALTLIFGGFQIGQAKVNTPEIAKQVIGDSITIPILRIGNPVYGATAVDYTIDGTDDNVQFQAALDALPNTGGTLQVVSSGTISFSATVSRAINNVSIIGTGAGTYFSYNASSAIFSAGSQSGWVFKDFKTDAGGLTITSATHYSLQNITINTTYYAFKSDDDATVGSLISSDLTTGRDVVTSTGGLLIDKVISGTAFPTSPKAGDQFLHNPSGRKWVYEYDGTTPYAQTGWKPKQSLGNSTIYVSKAGTDDLEHGTGTSATSGSLTTNQSYRVVTFVAGDNFINVGGANASSTQFKATGTTPTDWTHGSTLVAIDSTSFLTVQYAIDAIPPVLGGYCYVCIGDGTFAESVTITGKANGENYGGNTIRLWGTMSTVESLTCAAGCVKGATSTPGSLKRSAGSWTLNQRQNLRVRMTSGDNVNDIHIIDSNTAGDTLTITGSFWIDAPSAGETFDIQDWATIVTATNLGVNQGGVYIYDLKVTGSGFLGGIFLSGSWAYLQGCNYTGSNTSGMLHMSRSWVYAGYNLFKNTGGDNTLDINESTQFKTQGNAPNKYVSVSCNYVLKLTAGAYLEINGDIVDGSTNTTYGIFSVTNSVADMSRVAWTYPIVRNCTTGIYTSSGGMAGDPIVQYSGNSTNVVNVSTPGGGFDSAGSITFKPSGDTDDYITLSTLTNVPTFYGTGAYTRFGDAAFTSHTLASEDDVMVSGKLEVDGPLYADGDITAGTVTATSGWTKALGTDHTWSGAITTLVAGTNLVLGDLCYIGSDGKMEKAQGDTAGHVPAVAFCTGTIAEDASGVFVMQGFVRDDSWSWTPGTLLYVSASTAGLITSTIPTTTGNQDQIIGIAISATIIFFNPNYIVIEHA